MVAAHQPAADDADDGPLFIVPAEQPPLPAQPHPPEQLPLPPQPPAPQPAHLPAERVAPGRATPSPPWAVAASDDEDFEAPHRRRRWRPGCFTILLVLLAALVGGGVYAYQNGLVTPRLVLNAVGFGAAEIEFVNLRDDAIRADIVPSTQVDTVPAAFRLATYEIRTYRAVRPTRLQITLVAADGSSPGQCTLDLAASDRFQIVALPGTVLIRRTDVAPASGRELLLAESGICR